MGAHRTLSPWRFRWLTMVNPPIPLTAHEGPIGTLVEAGRRDDADRHGAIFKGMRMECGLSLGDVARGWGLSVVEVSELERGLRRFPASADLWAALQQLWCWGSEVNRDRLYRTVSPTPTGGEGA